MSLQIANDSQTFGSISGTGPNSITKTVVMPGPVSQVTAILTGFIVEFSRGDDHHLGQLDVQVQVLPGTSLPGTNVQVRIIYGLRDWSGNWDDQYDGTIFFAVVGE
jgi:hypothetical protein